MKPLYMIKTSSCYRSAGMPVTWSDLCLLGRQHRSCLKESFPSCKTLIPCISGLCDALDQKNPSLFDVKQMLKQQWGIMKIHTFKCNVQDLLSSVNKPIQEDRRSCKLLNNHKTPSAQYGQASLPTEMLLEWLLSYSTSKVLLSSRGRCSYLFSHVPAVR